MSSVGNSNKVYHLQYLQALQLCMSAETRSLWDAMERDSYTEWGPQTEEKAMVAECVRRWWSTQGIRGKDNGKSEQARSSQQF